MVLWGVVAILGATALPLDYHAIALRVAGAGLPDCQRYETDGSRGPCLPQFAVSRGRAVNGYSYNGEITFTEGATTRLAPDEFALLAGHEIAHWYLGHQARSPAAELAADRLGAELACRAGYDVAAGAGLFRFLRPSRFHAKAAVRREVVLGVGCRG